MLELEFTPRFLRDYKKLVKRHEKTSLLDDVVKLIELDDKRSKKILKRRHNMHKLTGNWEGSIECHVANYGDWLLVWQVKGNLAVLLRTGTHDEIFK